MSAKIKSRVVASLSKTAIAKLQAQAVKFHANIGNQLQKAVAANPGGVSATFMLKIFIDGKITEYRLASIQEASIGVIR